jgi:hypothetical protein
MEVYNQDAPVGAASVAGSLSAPAIVDITARVPTTVTLQQVGGNQGIYVTSVTLAGSRFAILEGGISSPVLIPNGEALDIVVEYTGTDDDDEQGLLYVEYSGDQYLLVDLVGKAVDDSESDSEDDDDEEDNTQPAEDTAPPTTSTTQLRQTTTKQETTATPTADEISDLDIEKLVIVNAETNQTVSFVEDWNGYPGSPFLLSIRAEPHGIVDSVRLTLSGPEQAVRVEGLAPYCLYGDIGGNYFGKLLPSGTYNVTAQAFGPDGDEGTLVWGTFSV